MSLPETIRLVDKWKPLTDAWSEAFREHASVRVEHGDFFASAADALVSPANSFGFMDGGLDLAIRARRAAVCGADANGVRTDHRTGPHSKRRDNPSQSS